MRCYLSRKERDYSLDFYAKFVLTFQKIPAFKVRHKLLHLLHLTVKCDVNKSSFVMVHMISMFLFLVEQAFNVEELLRDMGNQRKCLFLF